MLLLQSAHRRDKDFGAVVIVAEHIKARTGGRKQHGIPRARMMYLKVAQTQALEGVDLDAATAPARGEAKEAA